ncbi:MAG: chemotaxis protein CheR, partial [Cyanobacteria bacterium 13_1_20CM_4_61_6]
MTTAMLEASQSCIDEVEVDLLLEAVCRIRGVDFRDYARASVRRRIQNRLRAEKVPTMTRLLDKIVHDASCMDRFVTGLSVNVSTMFRDPGFFRALREHVFPLLRTSGYVRIWQPGCSMGEEVYSVAIMLAEEGLLSRCRIYATDINESALQKAREGIYPLDSMQLCTQNYIQAGGTRAFSEYYTAAYDNAIFTPALREQVVFAKHNLATDGPFNEFSLILCRNVLIYFNRALQDRVHRLLYDSLANFGVLGVGAKETLSLTALADRYE